MMRKITRLEFSLPVKFGLKGCKSLAMPGSGHGNSGIRSRSAGNIAIMLEVLAAIAWNAS